MNLPRGLVLAFIAVVTTLASAAPGQLDPSFGTGGIVRTAMGHGSDSGRAVVLQPDGKIVVAGQSHNGVNDDFAVARYHVDGTLDVSFNGTGKVTTAIGASHDQVNALAIDATGRIVVAGFAWNGSNNDFALARYNADGTLDLTFNGTGKVSTPIGQSDDVATALAIDASGRIVVAGYSHNGWNHDFALARYNADGTLDTTFMVMGKGTTAIGALDDFATALAIDAGGRLLVAGFSHDGSKYDVALARYLADGTLDTTFNGTGKVTTAIGAIEARANALAIDASGRIVVAGTSFTGAAYGFALVRYLANGTLDPSFNGTGMVTTAIGTSEDKAQALAIDASGRLVAAGYSHNGSNNDFALARYLDNGTLDATFAGTGTLAFATGPGTDMAFGVAVDGLGRLVAAGFGGAGGGNFAVTRLLPGGTLDASFGQGGIATTIISQAGFGSWKAIARHADGRIAVAGSSMNGSNTGFAVARYNVDGTLDTTFNGIGKVATAIGAGSDEATSLAIDSTGRLVVAGYSQNGSIYDIALARYKEDGALDPTFNGTGIVTAAFGSGNNFANALAIDASGRIVVGGTSESGAGSGFAVARYNANGTLDTTFNGTGMATASIGTAGFAGALALAIDSSGRIVLAGFGFNAAGNDFALARFNANGTLDTSFNGTGKVSTAFPAGVSFANAIAMDANGRIVVAGNAWNGSNNDFALARYNTDGTPDASFNGGGKVATAIGVGSDNALSLAIDSNGRIVVAGSSLNGPSSDFALARYNANGLPDTTFNGSGKVTTAIGTGNSEVRAILLQPNGKAVVAGFASDQPNGVLARYLMEPSPAPIAFAAQAGVALSATVTSNAVSVTGLEAPAPISVSGGSYSIGCGATFVTTPGTISSGQTVCVRHTSSSGYSQPVTTTLAFAGNALTFTSTTVAAPTLTVSALSLAFPGQAVGTTSGGQVVTITNNGGDAATGLFVGTGGDFAVSATTCGASLPALTSCTVTLVFTPLATGPRADELLVFSANAAPMLVSVPLAGTGTSSDTTPDAFAFVDQFLVPMNTVVTSAPVQITGLTAAAPVTVIGGTWSASSANACTGDVQAFTANAGWVSNGQYVCVRHASHTLAGESMDTQLIVGGLGDAFTSITIDTVPAPFALGSQSGVALSATRVSAPAVVTGINTGSPVSATGGLVSIGCNATYVASGTVLPGQALCARHTAAAAFGASTTTTVTVGGVSSTFTTTTFDAGGDADGDGIPNGVEYDEARNPEAKDNDVFGNARLFAMQQYRDFLGREGDPAGIAGWSGFVSDGAYTRNQVIDAFLSSDEFAGFVAPVVRLYFATFLRVPDYAGLSFNAALVRAGTVTPTQLADFFAVSPEFQATYGSLDDAQFVTLLYANVLGRAPDAAGLAGWVGLLQSGYTRGQVLIGFSESVEYRATMANEVFVTMMYAGMLHRTPEPAGFNGWVGFLDAGTFTREQVINGFFLSSEYRGRFLP